MHLVIISGSPRKNSITYRVALHLTHLFTETTDHEVSLVDVRDWALPHVQSVFTCVEKTPEPFKALSELVFKADAFILVSPEYNGSYSPALKNLLDHYPKQHHKPFGIVTASPGALGGIRAALEMQSLVSALFGIFSPYMLLAGGVEKKFDDQGNLIDDNFQHSVNNFKSEFLWLAEKLVNEKVIA
jgi:NAD(P)H-dependent FMN reductase